jgi:hypothetical protein
MNWEKYTIRPSFVMVLIYLSIYLVSIHFITSHHMYLELHLLFNRDRFPFNPED